VKSQKVVNFPFDEFDPTAFLASIPQETILRHKELLELKNKNIKNHDCNDEIVEFDLENEIVKDENNPTENGSTSGMKPNDEERDVVRTKLESNNNIKVSRRKRLVSTSLTKTPVMDTELVDYNNHKLEKNSDPFDVKYKLYAVIVSF
jgi:ubiquitin carboxyl-terminal hydrolase 6/32